MGMSSALSVSLTSLSAALVIPVRQIITWLLDIRGADQTRLSGVSLSNATHSDLEQMRSALFEHGVIVMPDQNLTPTDHIKLAEFLSDIDVNRFFTPVSNYPVVAEVRTSADQSAVIGGTWHTYHSYDQAPAMCSILSARQLPPYGGDAHFASTAAAYRAM
jgi:taurine dioxygenase